MGESRSASILVIGGGHNGLVCAAYLARAGHQVTVFEARREVGGGAVTREFADGYRVSGAAHLLYQLDAQIERELELSRHGLEMAAEGLDTISLGNAGRHVRLGDDGIEGAGEEDAAAWPEYRRKMSRFAGILARLHRRVPPRLGTLERTDLLELARLGLDIRRMGKNDMREFLRIAGINVHDILQEQFESDLLKGALSLDGTLGTFLGPRSNNSVFCALHRLSGGGNYRIPRGGMGAVIEALADAARSFGAELHTARPVSRLLLDFDRVVGVELASGEHIEGDLVISGADPKTTYLRLLGADRLEAGFANRVANVRARGAAARLHLALDALPPIQGLDERAMGQRLLIAPSLHHVEQAFNHAKYGRYSDRPVIEFTLPSLHDDSLAPSGHHVLSATVQWAPYELTEGWDGGREAFTEIVLDTLSEYMPELRRHLVHRELLAPPDLEREFGLPGGHWHHAELSLDQSMMMRPVPGAAQYRAPVEGLWTCSAGCHPGGGVMGLAGRNAAQAIISEFRS